MSEMEQRVGRLRELATHIDGMKNKVNFLKETLSGEELTNFESSIDGQDDDNNMYIDDDFGYVMANNRIFQIISEEELNEYEDIYDVRKVGDNEYTYVLKYSNSGCCFSEALEDGFNKIEKKD